MSEQHDQDDAVAGFSPAGMVVLVVDDDKLCLKVIAKMLTQCNYEVRTCSGGSEALSLLRDQKNHFDLVLSDVMMPDIDGFKLLEIIGLEMDIPVIMMSYDGDTHTVLKGVTHGAVDFLIKPVRMEELSNMWQHVVRKRARRPSEERAHDSAPGAGHASKGAGSVSSDGGPMAADAAPPDTTAGLGPGAAHESKKRTPEDRDAGAAAPPGSKRPRVHWSSQMHSQFVAAVNKLGIDKAVPKKILELMTVEGLTRENVASHRMPGASAPPMCPCRGRCTHSGGREWAPAWGGVGGHGAIRRSWRQCRRALPTAAAIQLFTYQQYVRVVPLRRERPRGR